jgi:hypothetical protein
MNRIAHSLNYVPSITFLLLASFFAARLAIGAFPSDPLAWTAYMTLASAWREIAAFVPADRWIACLVLLSCGALAAWSIASTGRLDRRRSRFVLTHMAFLAILLGMGDENVFAASAHEMSPSSASILPDFAQADPMMVVLLVLTALTCLQTHKAIIWALRHPVRRVQ